MSQQPLYRIVYADGWAGYASPWEATMVKLRAAQRLFHDNRPVRVERVSPAPRATGGER